jgi:hypothetical protein
MIYYPIDPILLSVIGNGYYIPPKRYVLPRVLEHLEGAVWYDVLRHYTFIEHHTATLW